MFSLKTVLARMLRRDSLQLIPVWAFCSLITANQSVMNLLIRAMPAVYGAMLTTISGEQQKNTAFKTIDSTLVFMRGTHTRFQPQSRKELILKLNLQIGLDDANNSTNLVYQKIYLT